MSHELYTHSKVLSRHFCEQLGVDAPLYLDVRHPGANTCMFSSDLSEPEHLFANRIVFSAHGSSSPHQLPRTCGLLCEQIRPKHRETEMHSTKRQSALSCQHSTSTQERLMWPVVAKDATRRYKSAVHASVGHNHSQLHLPSATPVTTHQVRPLLLCSVKLIQAQPCC